MSEEPTLKRPRIVFEPSGGPPAQPAQQPKQVEEVLDDLQVIQAKIDALNDEFSDQVLAIEQKFSLKRKPLYAERNLSLSAIPQFWLSTLQKHPSIHQVLDAEDIEILKYCYEVVVEDNEDIKTGYKIRFKFSENPYFVDEELVKTIAFCEGSQMYISSSLPQWNEGYQPTSEEEAQENQHAIIRRYNLFSDWFNGEEALSDDPDPIAEAIKEEIWTNPLSFYSSEEPMMVEAGEEYVEVDEGEDFEEEGDDGDEGEENEEEEIEA